MKNQSALDMSLVIIVDTSRVPHFYALLPSGPYNIPTLPVKINRNVRDSTPEIVYHLYFCFYSVLCA
ncbi:hypothetical protein FJ444_13785 [Aestuariibacter sp. GS-14]|uniref:hypothetical protein n=1 Tax=Aestuariibacter sp. GS-14 TaxID=2590670 RepID=UPI00112842ED|nr:hypothetical protein [Aestuariibacter sp. GS-14]TPV56826.1 hypothetical protein FJ444_13785 [Aestuariibacter sp. GS-14]